MTVEIDTNEWLLARDADEGYVYAPAAPAKPTKAAHTSRVDKVPHCNGCAKAIDRHGIRCPANPNAVNAVQWQPCWGPKPDPEDQARWPQGGW